MMRRFSLLFALCLCAVAPQGVAAPVAGVFQFVAGEVQVHAAAGVQRPARKGTPLAEGETVASGSDGIAQIKMGDGAIVVVQPRSQLTVVEFHYAGRVDGTERVRYRLERGGFRAVTGAIGRTNHDNYLIETPIAHMGVRGTDHESYYLTPQDAGADSSMRPGAYNKVNTGMTFLRNQSGEVTIGPNQVGYVASAAAAPLLLPEIPGFFNRGVAPRQSARSADTPARAQGATQPGAPAVVQTVSSADGRSLTSGTSSVAGGPSSAGAVAYTASGGNVSGRTGVNLAVVPNGALLGNAGGDPAFGVDWGSWLGGAPTVGGSATQGAVHVITTTQGTTAAQLAALPATVVTATYTFANPGAGGPPPTNQLGTAGTLNALSIGANFATQQITSYSLNATVGGANWVVNSGSGSFAQFGGAPGIAISGNCTGCSGGGAPTANGTAHGIFVGGAAERMMTTYGLKAANEGLSGAALLAR